MRRMPLTVATLAVALVLTAPAAANWLPHAAGAEWTYEWTDSVYSTTPTLEKVTVTEDAGAAFTLAWTTEEQGNPPESAVSLGQMGFRETTAGLLNTGWSSTPAPASFPILCSVPSPCNNSLAGTLYNVIWGSRARILAAPLLRGTRWVSTGGAQQDVASVNDYLGTELVSVPAFPGPVVAAKVRSEVTQAGALGDPYGSGIRTVWWVHGVGPVKVVFEHAGADNPLGTFVLKSTNQTPTAAPADTNYFPLTEGLRLRYRWSNTKHMRKPSVQQFELDQVANATARFTAQHVSGPIKVAGAYFFTLRTTGLTNTHTTTSSASIVEFPPLGPRSLPAKSRRHFRTPFDLLVFGFNPVLPAHPAEGDRWSAKVPSREFSIYGVTGQTRVLGRRLVRVPAGRFNALAVRSTLRQAGFPFGSGTRVAYFAPGRGLVKLVFTHGDGSVSTVELLK